MNRVLAISVFAVFLLLTGAPAFAGCGDDCTWVDIGIDDIYYTILLGPAGDPNPGDWFDPEGSNVQFLHDYVILSNYHWSYVHVQKCLEQTNFYRLIVNNQSIPSQWRCQYYQSYCPEVLDYGTCGVQDSEAEAMACEPTAQAFLTYTAGYDPWTTAGIAPLMPGADGDWYEGGCGWNIGIHETFIDISGGTWTYVPNGIQSACNGAYYRLIMTYGGQYRAQYFRPGPDDLNVIPSFDCWGGCAFRMPKASTAIYSTEAEARNGIRYVWFCIYNAGCTATEETNWGAIKSLY